MALTDKLSAIGEAIRAKTGKSDKLTLDQMPGEIAGIAGGGSGDVTLLEGLSFELDFSNGDMPFAAPNGYAVKSAIVKKPDTLIPENIKSGVEVAGITGTLSGGANPDANDPVYYVTFMNGDQVLYVRPVVSGDTCPNVVDQGWVEQPNKESTVQYNYTFYGWGASDGGGVDSNILKNITEDKTVYAIFSSTLRTYTITYLDEDGSLLTTQQLSYGTVPSYKPSKMDYTFGGWNPAVTAVTGEATYTAQWVEAGTIAYTWQEISGMSDAGTAANYMAVGDCKAVNLKGTMGTVTLDTRMYVYILGFNHNSTQEGTGVQFGCFKVEVGAKGKDVCIVSGKYLSSVTDGTKYFNMNHWGNHNYGGWAGCDLRYDVLGSTDAAPSNYGSAKTSGAVGYDASETCATNPVAGTLMSCFPADLRSVMKPITKWTGNDGGTNGKTVSASVDYLPLLAEYEVFGKVSEAYPNEKTYQKQYAFFASGNSKEKYKHSDLSAKSHWQLRSPAETSSTYFCYVNTSSEISSYYAAAPIGIAPVFMV